MEMLRSTLDGSLAEQHKKLKRLCESEDKEMAAIEREEMKTVVDPVHNRHQRRAIESIERKIKQAEQRLKDVV